MDIFKTLDTDNAPPRLSLENTAQWRLLQFEGF
jgi:hypothetical protein